MRDTILKEGSKAKGFKFEDLTDDISWMEGKEDYIGKIGEVTYIADNFFTIEFEDGFLVMYPASLMHLAVVEEEQPKKLPLKEGDKVKGFKFGDGTDGIDWNEDMALYVVKVGKVNYIDESYFDIKFENETIWSYPLSLMHLAVVDEQPKEEEPKVIEIDMSKVEKIEYYYNGKWQLADVFDDKYRFTMKDESKLKIQQEIKELEERINELKKQL